MIACHDDLTVSLRRDGGAEVVALTERDVDDAVGGAILFANTKARVKGTIGGLVDDDDIIALTIDAIADHGNRTIGPDDQIFGDVVAIAERGGHNACRGAIIFTRAEGDIQNTCAVRSPSDACHKREHGHRPQTERLGTHGNLVLHF
jgi:hypothetical protein